jgi:hypothetical protein
MRTVFVVFALGAVLVGGFAIGRQGWGVGLVALVGVGILALAIVLVLGGAFLLRSVLGIGTAEQITDSARQHL